jgi:hypothetical protein
MGVEERREQDDKDDTECDPERWPAARGCTLRGAFMRELKGFSAKVHSALRTLCSVHWDLRAAPRARDEHVPIGQVLASLRKVDWFVRHASPLRKKRTAN